MLDPISYKAAQNALRKRVPVVTKHGNPVYYDDPRLVYTGTWNEQVRSVAIKGKHKWTGGVGNTVSLTFVGDYIAWFAEVGTWSGIVEVILDGVSQGVFDCYYHDYRTSNVFSQRLPYGEHIITIKATGEKNELSSSAHLRSDSFLYTTDKIELVIPQQPGVVITFDDSRAETLTYAVPKLSEHGYKATCFINPGVGVYFGASGAWKIHWLRCYDYELTSHSYTHDDLTLMTEDEIRTNIVQAVEWLQKHNMDYAHMCPPHNTYNAMTQKIVQEHHASMSVGGNTALDPYDFDLYAIPRYPVDESSSLDTLGARLDEAKRANKVIVLYFHGVAPSATPPNITPEKFGAAIDMIAEKGLHVMRMKDFLPVV